jgi:HAD superfamily hydrolase (TIGR01490 family)
MAAAGVPRDEVLQACYRQYAGHSVGELAAVGRTWFEREQELGELFRPAVLDAFDGHRKRGDQTVLLSGSCHPCLDPLAAALGADLVICTDLETSTNRYTGRVRTLMTGWHKVTAARRLAAERGVPITDCAAYGDDLSDLPLLWAVGQPVVVGLDPRLGAVAERLGWGRLESAE